MCASIQKNSRHTLRTVWLHPFKGGNWAVGKTPKFRGRHGNWCFSPEAIVQAQMAVHYEDCVVMAHTLQGLTGFERGEGQRQACQMAAHWASPEAGNAYRWDGYPASLLASTLRHSGLVWRADCTRFHYDNQSLNLQRDHENILYKPVTWIQFCQRLILQQKCGEEMAQEVIDIWGHFQNIQFQMVSCFQ